MNALDLLSQIEKALPELRRLTQAGRDALDDGPPDDAPDAIQFSQVAADCYDRKWSAYTKELNSSSPERQTDLIPPASCGIGWGSLRSCMRCWEGEASVVSGCPELARWHRRWISDVLDREQSR